MITLWGMLIGSLTGYVLGRMHAYQVSRRSAEFLARSLGWEE